ncbi:MULTISPECIES: hypothetical protein [unclassified Streptomyces]|uniref:hypothetical protein n=1 Tax=unclassified Streptomyces TaxID=2593676 RepID=UPI00344C337C
MNLKEVAALLNHAGTIDSRLRRLMSTQQQAAETIRSWGNALAGVPATVETVRWDAARAVDSFYEQQGGDRTAQYRCVELTDILGAWSRRRAELLHRHIDPVPNVDPDNSAAYLAKLRADRQAVASGSAPPTDLPQLTGWQREAEIAARVAATGSPIPEHIRRELAPYRVLQARRDSTAA